MNAWKPVELALTGGARLLWPAFQAINRRFDAKSFQPEMGARAAAQEPRAHARRRSGWPRTTDSLCPTCVRETRARILSGEQALESLVNEHVGEIKAHIFERDGKVVVEKTCPIHGTFADTLAINPAFLRRLESLFPGPRLPRRHRQAAQPRHVVDQVRPRRGADDRPDQPLQHDVRPVLHGREPGRLRARADAGRSRRSSSTTRSASSRGGR